MHRQSFPLMLLAMLIIGTPAHSIDETALCPAALTDAYDARTIPVTHPATPVSPRFTFSALRLMSVMANTPHIGAGFDAPVVPAQELKPQPKPKQPRARLTHQDLGVIGQLAAMNRDELASLAKRSVLEAGDIIGGCIVTLAGIKIFRIR